MPTRSAGLSPLQGLAIVFMYQRGLLMSDCVFWRALTCGMLVLFSSTAFSQSPSFYLRPPVPQSFPSDHWVPKKSADLRGEVKQIKRLEELLLSLDQSQRDELDRLHADSALIVRGVDPEGLLKRIDQMKGDYQELIAAAMAIRWLDLDGGSLDLGPFAMRGKDFEAYSAVIRLLVIGEQSRGDSRMASRYLAAGFALAASLRRADDDAVRAYGIVLQNELVRSFMDLQSMGAGDLWPVIKRLQASQPSPADVDRLVWQGICDEIPVLADRPRVELKWANDVAEGFLRFGNKSHIPKDAKVAEQAGRQLQSLILQQPNVKSLQCEIKYQHGGFQAETNAPILPFSLTAANLVLANYVEDSLKRQKEFRQENGYGYHLAYVRCVEAIRRKSFEQQRWVRQIDADLRSQFPVDSNSGRPVTVTVIEGAIGLPAYRLEFRSASHLPWRQHWPGVMVVEDFHLADEGSN